MAEFLHAHPYVVLFLVIGLGQLIGRLPLGRIPLGATGGVLIVGLALGALMGRPPLPLPGEAPLVDPMPIVKELGFILFIYAVGLQAGPRFFDILRSDGKSYIILAFVVALIGLGATLGMSWIFDLDEAGRAGLLAGALTSSPTLAAAQDAVASGFVTTPPGMSPAALEAEIDTVYALTYLLGTGGLLVWIQALPAIMRVDLKASARALADELGDAHKDATPEGLAIVLRVYEVQRSAAVGQAIGELDVWAKTRCFIDRVRRGDEIFDATPQTVLQKGDRVSVVGDPLRLVDATTVLGPEVVDRALLAPVIETVEVVVSNPEAIGQPLASLSARERYGCFVGQAVRSLVVLPPESGHRLRRGDRLVVTGVKSRLPALVERLGNVERDLVETDLVVMAFGIFLGLLMGEIPLPLGDVKLDLGAAGGLLFSGIFVGVIRGFDPTLGRVPRAAHWVFTELGLLLFMAAVGLSGGVGVVEAVTSQGVGLMAGSVVVTAAPVLLGFVFGRYVLKLNPALLAGAVTGAMTSMPALTVVNQASDSELPALGYVGTYTFANVFLATAGAFILRF